MSGIGNGHALSQAQLEAIYASTAPLPDAIAAENGSAVVHAYVPAQQNDPYREAISGRLIAFVDGDITKSEWHAETRTRFAPNRLGASSKVRTADYDSSPLATKVDWSSSASFHGIRLAHISTALAWDYGTSADATAADKVSAIGVGGGVDFIGGGTLVGGEFDFRKVVGVDGRAYLIPVEYEV